MKNLLFLIVFGVCSAFFWDGSQISFMANDLAAARQKAGAEGKLIVVQFGARWCLPCNVMYEGAWQNADVVQFTTQNFVAVKMDVDQFDAMAWRDKFAVESIPATLILNSKGQEIKRFEGSMGSESLLGFLQTYAAPEHRSKINAQPLREIEPTVDQAEIETAEAQISADEASDLHPEEAAGEPEKKARVNQAPPRPHTDDAPKTEDRAAARPKTKADEKPLAAPAPAPRPAPKTEAPIAFSAPKKAEKAAPRATEKTAPRAAEKALKKPKRTGFTTQVGVFATPGQAEKLAVELSKRFGKRAFLVEANLNGRKVQRALLGDFQSRDEASAFKNRLKNSGFDAFVKNWSEMR